MNRTTARTVRFTKPFVLPGVEGEQPAGTYEVEIDEVVLPGPSFPVFRRVETRITVPFATMGASGHQTVPISLDALEAALARDAAGDLPAAIDTRNGE
ncbi:MAG: hypothetical protein JNM29_08880 [Candidatus Odyssella sp.]|nr:hypothetical protein [Candidatus Odyssella sp.]